MEKKNEAKQKSVVVDDDVVMKDASVGPGPVGVASKKAPSSILLEGLYRVTQINPKKKKQFHTQALVLEPTLDSKLPGFLMDVCKRYEGRSYCEIEVNQIVKLTITRQAPPSSSGYRMRGMVFKKVPSDSSKKTPAHVFFSCGGLIVDLSSSSTTWIDLFQLNEYVWFCLLLSK